MQAKVIAALAFIACHLTVTHAVWSDTTLRFNEGTAIEGRFAIDKEYMDGNTTTYTFALQKLPAGANRLNVAIGLKPVGVDDARTAHFTLKVPPPGTSDNYTLVAQASGKDYYSDMQGMPAFSNLSDFGEYMKHLALGYVQDVNGTFVDLLVRNSAYEVLAQSMTWDPEASEQVELSFKVNAQEPYGPNEVYIHWIFYDSTELGRADCVENCFTMDRVYGPGEPLVYQNLLTFSNYYDSWTIWYFYWTIAGVSFIWILGLPLQLTLSYALSGYMFFMDVKNFLNAFKWGNRSARQSLRLAIWWWFAESFLFWNVGTFLTVNLFLLLSMIPVVGPCINLAIAFIMQVFIFG